MTILRIEPLSGGQAQPEVMLDDFTGEVITRSESASGVEIKPSVVGVVRPKLPMVDKPKVDVAAAQRQRADEFIKQQIDPSPPKVEPKHNQLHTESGLVITVDKPRSWRRV